MTCFGSARLFTWRISRLMGHASVLTKSAARLVVLVAGLLGTVAPLVGAPAPAAAQAGGDDLFAVVVRVNEDIITRYELQQRIRLIEFASAGREQNPQARALEELIEDSLKVQEGTRRNIQVTDEVFENALNQIARNNRMTSIEQLYGALDQAGVERDTFNRQLRADIVWNLLIRQVYGARLRPQDSEIDAAIERAETEGAVTYDVRQIVIPLAPQAPPPQVQQASQRAVQVREQLTSCDVLEQLAPQYPPHSGRVGPGPITAEQMPGPFRERVLAISVGEVAEPIRSQQGVHLIMLCGTGRQGAGSREQVMRRLMAQRADRFSSNLLSELRRAAIIVTEL